MSAMGPEFFHFMQKLEENGDKLPPSTLSIIQQPFEFEFNNSTCNICNGYYGPSFGEPVCVTCHAFLFPDLPTYHPSTFFADKTDDRDSGNDEPSDLNYSAERRMVRLQFPPWFYRNSMDYETSPEDEPRQAEAANPGPAVPAAGGSGSGGSNDNAPPPADLAVHKKKKKNVPAVPDLRVGHSPPLPTPNVERFLQVLSTPRLPDNLEPGLVEQLPSEVLLCIFSYLDDLSLCACGAVSARWGGLVRARVPPPRWAHFVATRWPLYKPMQPHVDWYKKYLALVESSFCRNCLVQMCVLTQPTGDESHWRLNRLKTELKMLRNDPPEGIAATPLDPKSCHWQASVTGPVGSPYEGGVFYLYIQVPYNYPMSPPVVRFLTRIIHPNVSRHGDVGIDSVHHNWTLALTISKVLISIQSLLTDPYTAVCMEPELGEMYVHDRPRFESLARRWTWRYAMLDVFNQT